MNNVIEETETLVGLLAELRVGREAIPSGQWNALRAHIAKSALVLREALTPSSDLLFAQISNGRRAFQILVLAVEHWMSRGMLTGGESWRVVLAACDAAMVIVREQGSAK